jgi:enolase
VARPRFHRLARGPACWARLLLPGLLVRCASRRARTVHYYLERTADGSSLSRVVSAWVLARLDPSHAWRFIRQALESDVADSEGGTTGHAPVPAAARDQWPGETGRMRPWPQSGPNPILALSPPKNGGSRMLTIEELSAVEILDSRAHPTLAVTVRLSGDVTARAGVPSGASTGSREARELRDQDSSRFGGLGVRTAVGHVNGEIAAALCGRTFANLAEVDAALIDLDGTPGKARLGANAIVGVSMATARAIAVGAGVPLWWSLAPPGIRPRLPVPHFNVINGGVHAPNRLDFQEFMLAPLGAPSVAEAVRAGAEIYAALRGKLGALGLSTGLGDEGGFAPEIDSPEEVLSLLAAAIEDAGYRAGRDGVAIALDPAASEFYAAGAYAVAGERLSGAEMIERYAEMTERFPVWSIEDGLAESDWDGWERMAARLGGKIQLVGDDILVTNPAIIREAADRKIANAALIKPNQIGTVTETLEAMRVCREAGWAQMVSHRSGETEDTFIADLAVGSGCGQIKSGAPARGERTAKYNRLVEIEAVEHLPYGLAR